MLEEIEELIGFFIYNFKNIDDIYIPLNSKYQKISCVYDKNTDSIDVNLHSTNISSIYENNNLIALVGENGTGKSNIVSALASVLRMPYESEKEDYYNYEFPAKYCLIFKVKQSQNNLTNCYRYKTNIKNSKILIDRDNSTRQEEQYSCALFKQFLQMADDAFPLEFPMDETWEDIIDRKLKNYFYYDRFRSYDTSHSLRNLFAFNKNKSLYIFEEDLAYLFFDKQTREINLEKRFSWLEYRFSKITKYYYRPRNWTNKDFWRFTDNVKDLLQDRKKLIQIKEYLDFDNFVNKAFPILCLTFLYIQIGILFSKLEGNENIIDGDILDEGLFYIISNNYDYKNLHSELSVYYAKIKKHVQEVASNDYEIKRRLETSGFLKYFNDLLEAYINIEKELSEGKNRFKDFLETQDGNLLRLKFMVSVNSPESEAMIFLNNLGIFEINYYKEGDQVLYPFTSLSTGEQHILRFFADFYATLSYTNIFIFDEMDLSWHPEWQRKFINIVLDFLKFINKPVNVIFTTHSPIILSDLASESVVLLQKIQDNNQNYITRIIEPQIKTFGANIHRLLAHPFFMKSTIGNFAETKIKNIVYKLHNEEFQENTFKEINEIINLLDSSVQKTILLMMKNKYEQRRKYEKNNK